MLRYGLLYAWFVSIVATCGSLFFSEIMHYEPCKLCWLQRICMYPLVIILGYAVLKEDRKYSQPAYVIVMIGWGIALYHYLGQKITSVGKLLPCNVGIPCNVDYINWLGFITIPLLAFTAFSLILLCLWISRS
ncbi:disulfide oxidoreductase [Paenibacillus sp. Y412MC10]|uniref:disulfide oxidoreductase n=1 Tax=Geobacillus sp. (strain Y412MC10) TaxID=481743 RepID=UPI0028CBA98B|nr:disulfide oxidoreductase [Paenibacillus sp. Y412MC10]